MNIVKLQGGLGNQLFQWAFYKHLKHKYKVDCYLDVGLYNNQVGITKREFSLNKFPNINYEINSKIDNFNYSNIFDNFYHTEHNLSPNINYYFEGYWQTEKYFKEIENEIKYDLSPGEEIKKKLNKIIPINNNSISLHIRRGDYLNNTNFHPVQSMDYYKKALEIIGHYDNILVFSDDIEWCKNNIKFENVNFIEGISDIENIFLMSMCKDNIIANSSFSWWGAWLNNNKDKKIIAPKNWFGPQLGLNTSDIVPETWIKI